MTVVSHKVSLPELCGDVTYYVDLYGVESIADRMYNVLTDEGLKQDLIQKSLEREEFFSWEMTAKETRKIFDEVINN